jgi:hypothetical protein
MYARRVFRGDVAGVLKWKLLRIYIIKSEPQYNNAAAQLSYAYTPRCGECCATAFYSTTEPYPSRITDAVTP